MSRKGRCCLWLFLLLIHAILCSARYTLSFMEGYEQEQFAARRPLIVHIDDYGNPSANSNHNPPFSAKKASGGRGRGRSINNGRRG